MGRVTNKSGIAVKGASVSTKPYTDSVSTNDEGYFFINRHLINQGQEIRQLKEGKYQLIINSSGYKPFERPVTLSLDQKQPKSNVYRLVDDVGDFKRQDPIKDKVEIDNVNHSKGSPKHGPP